MKISDIPGRIEYAMVKAAYEESPRREKQTAWAERDLWDIVTKAHRDENVPVPGRRDWFRSTFAAYGISAMETDRRSRILGRGPLADPIWDLLEEGKASMDAACNALVEAERSPDPAASVRAFCEHKRNPGDGFHEVTLPSGKRMVRRSPKRGTFDAPPAEFDVAGSRAATAAFKEVARKVLDSKLAGIEDYGMRKSLEDDFEFAVRVACDDLMKGIAAVRHTGLAHSTSRKVSLRSSFEVLGVPPPRRAMTDEDRNRAYNAYRKLAKTYHPDRNPGDDAALEQFRAVNVAWDAIKDHRE